MEKCLFLTSWYIFVRFFTLDSYTNYLWIVDKLFVEVINVKCFFFFWYFYKLDRRPQ